MTSYNIKSLIHKIIPEAAIQARGDYPAFSQRDLYYVCRDTYLNHPDRPFHREYMLKRQKNETDEQYEARRDHARRVREPIDYQYFISKIIRGSGGYEAKFGPIDGMIREGFGIFVEPHSDDSLLLGTLEVGEYDLPSYKFDKILIVEKRTEKPKFEHDHVADRHDMGIVYSGGYATEALHDLLGGAQDGDYQIFVWHDADPDGYNIVRNIREQTQNMPMAIEVIDLGLTVEQALDLGLSGEPFAEDRALANDLLVTLSDVEREYFEERRIRFEINSIPTDQRISYVEVLLRQNGIRPKYIPPDGALQGQIEWDYGYEIRRRVETAIEQIIDQDAIVSRVTEVLRDEIQLNIEEAEEHIRSRFEERPRTTWRLVVDTTHSTRAEGHADAIKGMVREQMITLADAGRSRRR